MPLLQSAFVKIRKNGKLNLCLLYYEITTDPKKRKTEIINFYPFAHANDFCVFSRHHFTVKIHCMFLLLVYYLLDLKVIGVILQALSFL